MEEEFKDKGIPPTLLNLIPDGREWKVKEAEDGGRSRSTSLDAHEDEKLELKLGLPGVQEEERAAASREKIQQQQQESSSAPYLGRLPTHSKPTTSIATTGAKRGFLAAVGAIPEGYNQSHRDREECGNELTLGGENMAGERKKGCNSSPPPSHGSAAVHSSNPQGRGAIPPVVGWPPIRSFRRNLTNGSSSKQSPEQQNCEADDKVKLICKKRPLVKINMDGIPIGRKVDLAVYDSYQKLSSAVEGLFRGFLEAQKDLSCAESGEQGTEEKIFSGLLDGTGEYTLVYEDNDGDRMLVGDIPWNVFVLTAKRLRVMRRSELPHDMQIIASPNSKSCQTWKLSEATLESAYHTGCSPEEHMALIHSMIETLHGLQADTLLQLIVELLLGLGIGNKGKVFVIGSPLNSKWQEKKKGQGGLRKNL